MESNLPFINSEIDDIITNKDKSVERIECLLDTLLGYAAFGMGNDEFKRLNAYYSSFNPKNAGAYDNFYNEANKE